MDILEKFLNIYKLSQLTIYVFHSVGAPSGEQFFALLQ